MSQLRDDRYFSPEPIQRKLAHKLYESVRKMPLVCPHGHVDPRLLATDTYQWGTPVDLFIIPDHYILRMLYSQSIPLEKLGIRREDGTVIEQDHRKIWQTVCDSWYLFRGTPSALWLQNELHDLFEVETKLNSSNAQIIYDQITEKLQRPEFQPRRLFERFNIEVLATTDAATDTLTYHKQIQASNWSARIIPTFRPDAVVNIDTPQYTENIQTLSRVSGVEVRDYHSYISALEQRRGFFKEMGATATDSGTGTAYTERLSEQDAESIFQRALRGSASSDEAQRFTGHMLIEMARMSVEDGLVMQMHIGSYRDHNAALFTQFGKDVGADIPLASEFTRNLKPLLDLFGNEPALKIIVFNLDETVYSRELAPLAGHYPALRLGPPWWFYDSPNGIRRYFENVVETAGLYNTVGFNDDTRAYPSIPARHDLWRRISSDWLAGLVTRALVDEDDAHEMIQDMAYHLTKRAYNV